MIEIVKAEEKHVIAILTTRWRMAGISRYRYTYIPANSYAPYTPDKNALQNEHIKGDNKADTQ
jgi:hypothetical protein